MRIAYFSRTEIPARTANSVQIVKMCNAFATNGHEVTLYFLSQTDEKSSADPFKFYGISKSFEIKRIRVPRVGSSRLSYLFSTLVSFLQLLWEVRKDSSEVIYSRDLVATLAFGLGGSKTNIFETHFPVFHNHLEGLMFRFALSRKYISRVVVISRALEQAYSAHYGKRLPEVVVAPDGADKISVSSMAEVGLGVRDNQMKLGYVGHLYCGKGMEMIDKLAAEMSVEEFHVVGGFEKDIQYWKGRIKSPNVFFQGFVGQSKLGQYLRKFDVCLLPNQREVRAFGAEQSRNSPNISQYTSPLKLFEYMAYGKPIIASDLPVLREVLDDEIALLVDPEDVKEWIAAVNILKDRGVRERYGAAARRRFEHNYTWQHRARNVLASTDQNQS